MNDIKPYPTTELGEWRLWQNDFESQMVRNLGKSITVERENEQGTEAEIATGKNLITGEWVCSMDFSDDPWANSEVHHD